MESILLDLYIYSCISYIALVLSFVIFVGGHLCKALSGEVGILNKDSFYYLTTTGFRLDLKTTPEIPERLF